MGCNGCWLNKYRRTNGQESYDCESFGCETKCKENVSKCQCTCCKEKQKQFPPAAVSQPLHSASSNVESQTSAQRGTNGPESDTDNRNSETSPGPSISPETIAAVIVAIIVAIILLDLCIFRFPVGRNIRDFLVRKIPFCIAFYS